jgi:thiol-disulfide isomerase/thioredoxin
MRKFIISFLFVAVATAIHGQVKSGLNLCLRDEETGDWLIGLFDDFAVYNCECWDYQKADPENGEFVLVNGCELLPLRLTDRTLQISKQQHRISKLTDKTLPDYPTKDGSDFVDNGFKGGKATLCGCLINVPPRQEEKLKLRVSNPLQTVFDDEQPVITDSLGRFRFDISLTNTGIVNLLWTELILTPGHTYFIFMDGATGQTFVMGKDARLNNEMIAHGMPRTKIQIHEFSEKTDAELLAAVENDLQKAQEQWDRTEQESPNLSKRYRQLCRWIWKMGAAFQLVQRRYESRDVRQCKDGKLWKWIHDNVITDLPRPYTLQQNNLAYVIDNYTAELLEPRKTNYSTEFIEAAIDIAEEKKDQFDEAYMDSLHLLRQEMTDFILKAEQETPEPEMENHPFHDLISKMTGKGSLLLGILSSTEPQEQVLLKNIGRTDQLDLTDELKDLSKAVAIYSQLEQAHVPLTDLLRKALTENVRSPFYKQLILQRSDDLEALAANIGQGGGSLMPNEMIEGLTDGKEILGKILAPYRGRVVYLDIWGTWCVPCKSNLKRLTKPMHQALAGLPVTYLYLCNNSSDKAWRSVISEYELTGSNSIHYNLPTNQEAAVEKYLGVSHYPTYILFDTEGNPLPDEVKPYDLNVLRQHIEQLLK